jgi:hypothetical protein
VSIYDDLIRFKLDPARSDVMAVLVAEALCIPAIIGKESTLPLMHSAFVDKVPLNSSLLIRSGYSQVLRSRQRDQACVSSPSLRSVASVCSTTVSSRACGRCCRRLCKEHAVT